MRGVKKESTSFRSCATVWHLCERSNFNSFAVRHHSRCYPARSASILSLSEARAAVSYAECLRLRKGLVRLILASQDKVGKVSIWNWRSVDFERIAGRFHVSFVLRITYPPENGQN